MSVETVDQSKAIVTKALSAVGEIATLPEVTVKIIEVVEDPNGTARQLHDVIKHDPALSAKVLKVVNSAFYGLPGQVASVDRAVILLGLSAVKNIAIAASLAQMFKGRQEPDLFEPSELWKHSIAVAVAAKKLAPLGTTAAATDEIFLAGLIHDLGLIIERQVFPDKLAEVCRRAGAGEGAFLDLEREVIGATHEDFGFALTTKWRFPGRLRAAVGCHHHPESVDEEFRSLVWLLRCSDVLCSQRGIGFERTTLGDELTDDMLSTVSITREHLAEVQETLEDAIQEAEAVLGSVS